MRRLIAFVTALLLAPPLAADGVEVDLELVLMVDVSRSMSEHELEIQRRGYATALRSAEVYDAIQSGFLQTIALAYVEWAGSQEIVVDWRLIETRADLTEFADILTTRFNPTLRRTSISEALVFGTEMLETNSFDGLRRVIDISGDGPNNEGRPVIWGRKRALEAGITINGLPLMTRDGMGSDWWHLEGLDIYYETCVTGGIGSFVIPVFHWKDFADAVRRKLVLEIAARPEAQVILAQSRSHDPTDCMIGEKLWEQRRQYWSEP